MTTNKYHNHKSSFRDKTFDSRLEKNRYLFLQDQERRGAITDLKCQVRFPLFPVWRKLATDSKGRTTLRVYKRECAYIADFTYLKDGQLVVEDTKGFETDAFRVKEHALWDKTGIEIRKVKTSTEPI